MFEWLRVYGFESSVNKVFLKEKLVDSNTINLQLSIKGANLVQPRTIVIYVCKTFYNVGTCALQL